MELRRSDSILGMFPRADRLGGAGTFYPSSGDSLHTPHFFFVMAQEADAYRLHHFWLPFGFAHERPKTGRLGEHEVIVLS